MGILSNIFHKIFPSSHPAVQQPAVQMAAQPAAQGQQGASAQSGAAQPAAAPARAAPPPAASAEPVDVEAILNAKAAQAGEKLNWRTSIVDLLKLLELDSSLAARKELAHELRYTGDPNDSAQMNLWLHRQVMQQLAANGGRVPAELMH